ALIFPFRQSNPEQQLSGLSLLAGSHTSISWFLFSFVPQKSHSMYHAMGYSSILLMQAAMTFDPKDMDVAMASLKEALHTCQRFRRKPGVLESLASFWHGQPVENLTEEEMHAELCYAEVLMQKAALTFLDESVIGFIKGGMGMRNSYLIYKSTHIHFRGGVNMGIGSFNLILSMLPSRVLRLMEFLGFSGDRVGDATLSAPSNSLRSILSTLTLLMFHLYLSVILGEETFLIIFLWIEPEVFFLQGALMLFYTARIAVLKGNFTSKFLACIATQEEWRQIHHLCYWELMWAYSFEQNWTEAYRYADRLCKENKWSQATYVFQKAAILSMLPEEEVAKTGENVVALFRQVDGLRLRIAGKSIPTEKFAAKKAQRYASPKPLRLEMMYVWNGFTVVGKRPELTEGILLTLEAAEEQLRNDPEFHTDDVCVVQMLKGLCLTQLGRLVQAEICFNFVISSEKDIKHDTYLVPFTMYELGLLHKLNGDFNSAITVIENAKYVDYSMESRLHFRIHAALNTMGSFQAKLPPSRTPA
uniref:Tetratricopeptide repeat protein 39B n=1 Tax=Xiphophorus couchianus TaxID=32473 RepID=A0A3B5LPV0_9TELE